MRIEEVVKQLEIIAPTNLAEPFDSGKIGLVLDRNNEINKIAVALDATERVLNEAVKNGADMLITHHPLIFHPINKISFELSGLLKVALENNISIYTMHTNFDKVYGGINDALAEVFGLKNLQYNLPIGRIGEMSYIRFPTEFTKYISSVLNVPVQAMGDHDGGICKVMVVGGNGFTNENIELAKNNKVDAFISGEMNYHTFRYVENAENMILIAASHYATEAPGMKALSKHLSIRLDIKTIYVDDPPKINYFDEREVKNEN